MNKVIALLLSLLFLSCQTSYEPLKEGENRVLGKNFNTWDDESCYNDSTLIGVRTWKGKKLMPYNIFTGSYDISELAFTCYTEFGIAYIWQNFYLYGMLSNETSPVRLQSDSQLDERARKYCEREHDKVAVYQGNIQDWTDNYPDWMFADITDGREYFCK